MNSVPTDPCDNAIVCKCKIAAIQFTVRKDGPNQGCPLYKCGNKNSPCDFFMWADESNHLEPGATAPAAFQNKMNSVPRDPSNNSIVCNCKIDAIQFTVRKDGPNQGRLFYKCNNRRCDFFMWADESNHREPGATAPAAFQNKMNSVPRDPSNNSIVCNCKIDAIQFTVRKDGPNQGRLFYKCNNRRCDFFMWADNRNHPEPNYTRDQGPTRRSTSSDFNDFNNADDGSGEVTCQCGQSARRCTVKKNSPNKGREFYGCPKPRHSRCQFFEWVDSPEGGSNFGGGRGGGTKRKCGACGQEGHTRPKCAKY